MNVPDISICTDSVCSANVCIYYKCVCLLLILGPTVLEVFNTLLRHLRLSVDYELTGSYDCTNIGIKIIKEHEERQLQEAVIRTIGVCVSITWPTFQSYLNFLIFHFYGLYFKIRLICKHVTHVPAFWGDALHHGKGPHSRHASLAALYRLRVSTAVTSVSLNVCYGCQWNFFKKLTQTK